MERERCPVCGVFSLIYDGRHKIWECHNKACLKTTREYQVKEEEEEEEGDISRQGVIPVTA